jgi:hypothetical protein
MFVKEKIYFTDYLFGTALYTFPAGRAFFSIDLDKFCLQKLFVHGFLYTNLQQAAADFINNC